MYVRNPVSPRARRSGAATAIRGLVNVFDRARRVTIVGVGVGLRNVVGALAANPGANIAVVATAAAAAVAVLVRW